MMARLAATSRPPILTMLGMLAAVFVLAPRPNTYEPVVVSHPRQVVVEGTPHGDLYVPPAGIDPRIVHPTPNVDPQINLYRGPIPDVGLDDVVSGFLGLLTPPMPPHC